MLQSFGRRVFSFLSDLLRWFGLPSMPGWRRLLWLPTRFWPESQNFASCDLLDFIDVDEQGGVKVDLKLAKRLGLGHLIKQPRINKDGIQDIELEANQREKGTQREKRTSLISTV